MKNVSFEEFKNIHSEFMKKGTYYNVKLDGLYIKNGVLTGFWPSYFPEFSNVLVIPEGVTEIASCACKGMVIGKVVIPKSVEHIADEAFRECPILRTVIFEDGSNLKNVGNKAFSYCYNLVNFVLPNSNAVYADDFLIFTSPKIIVTKDRLKELTKSPSRSMFKYDECNETFYLEKMNYWNPNYVTRVDYGYSYNIKKKYTYVDYYYGYDYLRGRYVEWGYKPLRVFKKDRNKEVAIISKDYTVKIEDGKLIENGFETGEFVERDGTLTTFMRGGEYENPFPQAIIEYQNLLMQCDDAKDLNYPSCLWKTTWNGVFHTIEKYNEDYRIGIFDEIISYEQFLTMRDNAYLEGCLSNEEIQNVYNMLEKILEYSGSFRDEEETIKVQDRVCSNVCNILKFISNADKKKLVDMFATIQADGCIKRLAKLNLGLDIDIEALSKAEADNGDSENILLFAKEISGANIEVLSKGMANTGNKENIFRFAKEIPGANIEVLTNAMANVAGEYARDDEHWIYRFAKEISGANIDSLTEAIVTLYDNSWHDLIDDKDVYDVFWNKFFELPNVKDRSAWVVRIDGHSSDIDYREFVEILKSGLFTEEEAQTAIELFAEEVVEKGDPDYWDNVSILFEKECPKYYEYYCDCKSESLAIEYGLDHEQDDEDDSIENEFCEQTDFSDISVQKGKVIEAEFEDVSEDDRLPF